MKLKLFYLLNFFIFCVSLSCVYPQNISPEKIVDIKVKTSRIPLKKDGIIDVYLILKIKQGWHINSDNPLDSNLSPTSIKFKDNPNFKVVKISYPPPLLKKLSFSDSESALFENETTIKVVLKPILKAVKGKILVKGEVNYQLCNDETCLFPISKPFNFIL
ncbi:MAG: protein-disulfide reductase DsbD domain-containing protein [Ignavibacteriaceae bacterium]